MWKKQLLRKLRRSRRAISPVIATVIIVAVAIAVAIAVAYWVTGIVPAFTRYEELKVSSSYVDNENIAILVVRNTGSAEATIAALLVNGRLNDTTRAWDSVTYVTGEVVGTTGPTGLTGTATNLDNYPVLNYSVTLFDTVNTYIDLGNGTLDGAPKGTATITYATGALTIDTEYTANSTTVTANYAYSKEVYTLDPGERVTLIVFSACYPIQTYLSGVVYDFTINTAAGGSYPSSARAP